MKNIDLILAICCIAHLMSLQAILRLKVRVHKLEKEKNGED